MALPLIHVDAFADRPFAGNPAAVCLLDGPREPGWMQALAAELNLPETAFVTAHADGFGLRWFTPTIEVDLCGHATLAAAHALWQERRLAPDAAARFHTRSGLLTAARRDAWIELDFPAEAARQDGAHRLSGLASRWNGARAARRRPRRARRTGGHGLPRRADGLTDERPGATSGAPDEQRSSNQLRKRSGNCLTIASASGSAICCMWPAARRTAV